MALGPVEYALIAFEGNKFTGDIVPALVELVDAGLVHIIDLVFLMKDEDGSVLTVELEDLPGEASDAFAELECEIDDLVNSDDLLSEAELLAPGTAAALIVWENLWAMQFAEAVRAAGGFLADYARVPAEVAEAAMADFLADAE